MKHSWWKWVLGLAALGFAGYALFGVAIAVISVVGVVLVSVITIAMALLGVTLKMLLPLAFFVGLGYGLYRFFKSRSRGNQINTMAGTW